MVTPKKKHLIELMIEAGVKWPDGAEYAAQDKRNNKLYFFAKKPKVMAGDSHYCADDGTVGGSTLLPSICRNWHQTIVTREQYADYLAVVHEWNASVGELLHEAQSNQVRESNCYPVVADTGCFDCDNPPSIEQLTAYYHAKAEEADRLQSVADDALKAADDALLALEKAGELIGLVISIDTKPKQEVQPEITNWRDLRVGDVVEYTSGTVNSRIGMLGVVDEIDFDDADFPIRVMIDGEFWWCNAFRFIRRP